MTEIVYEKEVCVVKCVDFVGAGQNLRKCNRQ